MDCLDPDRLRLTAGIVGSTVAIVWQRRWKREKNCACGWVWNSTDLGPTSLRPTGQHAVLTLITDTNLYGSLPGLILKEFDYVERLSVDSRMTRQPRETQNTLRLNILL